MTTENQASEGEPTWKVGNEFAPYHPDASHVAPDYRDGWNACYRAALAAQPQQGLTPRQLEVLEFLYGAGPLDGKWFEPEGKPKYWWRTVLREAFGKTAALAAQHQADDADLLEIARQGGVDVRRQDLRDAVWVGYTAALAAQPQAAPVALAQEQWPPTPSAYQGDQYVGYSRTDLLKYAQDVLAAHGIPAPQTKEPTNDR